MTLRPVLWISLGVTLLVAGCADDGSTTSTSAKSSSSTQPTETAEYSEVNLSPEAKACVKYTIQHYGLNKHPGRAQAEREVIALGCNELDRKDLLKEKAMRMAEYTCAGSPQPKDPDDYACQPSLDSRPADYQVVDNYS